MRGCVHINCDQLIALELSKQLQEYLSTEITYVIDAQVENGLSD